MIQRVRIVPPIPQISIVLVYLCQWIKSSDQQGTDEGRIGRTKQGSGIITGFGNEKISKGALEHGYGEVS